MPIAGKIDHDEHLDRLRSLVEAILDENDGEEDPRIFSLVFSDGGFIAMAEYAAPGHEELVADYNSRATGYQLAIGACHIAAALGMEVNSVDDLTQELYKEAMHLRHQLEGQHHVDAAEA